ncbi:efflux RND transporter periplasmic adaptor subunit [Kerstersia similis]|uniref:efflux RND transporter periplasmic adaptor subunit n=1 Tax=Kerstersia similis TaxID=206505 RepID=UPI0039EDEE62
MKRNTGFWGMAAVSVTVAALAVVVLLVTDRSNAEASGAWPITKVALAPVERTVAPRALHGVGALEAARQVALAAETPGRVTRIAFESGQTVKAGQLLVQMNDAPEQAERLRLQAQLRNAETVLARTRMLKADQVATQEQLDKAIAARDMAKGELRRVEAVIAQKAVRAPFDGVIGIRRVHEGQYLNAGEAVASLVDAGTMHVNFSLDEQAVRHLQPQQPVVLQLDAWPEQAFDARITAIDPLIGASRTVQVQASLPNVDGKLRAGMFAGIRVQRPQQEEVLAVPETALTYNAYGQTVFIARQAETQGLTVHRVAVKTGERWDGRVEIESGLAEGDQVVVSGQIKLSDGMQVEPVASNTLNAADPHGQAPGAAPAAQGAGS